MIKILITVSSLFLAGCSVSYSSNLTVEFGGYKLVKTEALESLEEQAEKNYETVLTETRVAD